jgi:hypothetical protein
MNVIPAKIHEVIALFLQDMKNDAGCKEMEPILQALQEYLQHSGRNAVDGKEQIVFSDAFSSIRFQEMAHFCRDFIPVNYLAPLADQLLACLNLRRLFRWAAARNFFPMEQAREICWLLFLAESEIERADRLFRSFHPLISRGRPPTSEFAGDLWALQKAQQEWWERLPRMKEVLEGFFFVQSVDGDDCSVELTDLTSEKNVKPVKLNPDIVRLINESDGFTAELGYDGQYWHVLNVGPIHPAFVLAPGSFHPGRDG